MAPHINVRHPMVPGATKYIASFGLLPAMAESFRGHGWLWWHRHDTTCDYATFSHGLLIRSPIEMNYICMVRLLRSGPSAATDVDGGVLTASSSQAGIGGARRRRV